METVIRVIFILRQKFAGLVIFSSSLRIDSELVEDDEILRNHVVEHFFNAFHDDGLAIVTGLVTRLIPPLVTTPENDTVCTWSAIWIHRNYSLLNLLHWLFPHWRRLSKLYFL